MLRITHEANALCALNLHCVQHALKTHGKIKTRLCCAQYCYAIALAICNCQRPNSVIKQDISFSISTANTWRCILPTNLHYDWGLTSVADVASHTGITSLTCIASVSSDTWAYIALAILDVMVYLLLSRYLVVLLSSPFLYF